MENTLFNKILIHGIIAFIGGVSRYWSRVKRPRIITTLIEGTIGSFVGVVFGLISACWIESQYFQLAMAGLGGWVGREGMEWLFLIVKRSFKSLR